MLKKRLRFKELKNLGIVNNWASLKNLQKNFRFPPGKLTGGIRSWTETEIQEWIDACPVERIPSPQQRKAEAEATIQITRIGHNGGPPTQDAPQRRKRRAKAAIEIESTRPASAMLEANLAPPDEAKQRPKRRAETATAKRQADPNTIRRSRRRPQRKIEVEGAASDGGTSKLRALHGATGAHYQSASSGENEERRRGTNGEFEVVSTPLSEALP